MKKNKLSSQFNHRPGSSFFAILIMILLALIFTICILLQFRYQIRDLKATQKNSHTLQHHFVYIASDYNSPYSESIYAVAKKQGAATGDYVEFMGRNLDVPYTKYQLMDIAIDSKADGIIVEGDETEALTKQIYIATQKGIPVVTVGTDCTGSARKSYIGLSYYSLGQEYGQQVIRLVRNTPQNVLILMSPNTIGTGQNLIFSGIRDVIVQSGNARNFQLSSMATGDGSMFSAEESISDIFSGQNSSKMPDIIVCLDETNTTCACQAVVDYNQVGNVSILGNYSNSTILNAISKNILTCSITVDTQKMGKDCINCLNEYLSSGFVSQFAPISPQLITADNVSSYLPSTSEASDENN
ncbi:MAG: substrate-binding domain-containing protein [Butyrivibrio sp.]|nr:substrate-binding domain-containing protein [Butyrivibrio sp.]